MVERAVAVGEGLENLDPLQGPLVMLCSGAVSLVVKESCRDGSEVDG